MASKSSPAPHEQGSLLSSASSSAPVVASSGALAALAPKLDALDKFAEANNLAVLTEGKGSFTAALSVADAINQLKLMLTDDIMQPIMALQGTALGFKTDKDKPTDGSKPGYPVEVVRECFIEATLKGFKMVGNQSNIIAARFYATKEGFEDFFLRKAKAGEFLDFRDTYSVPKVISENEAHVTVSATWKWKGTADKIEPAPIAIRINKGQGADAVLGKAKRKLLARIYARVTGTVISEGDASEGPVVDVTATPAGAAPAGVEFATEEQQELLKKHLEPHAEKANHWLVTNGGIVAGQTYLNVKKSTADKILKDVKGFLGVIGATV